MIKVGICGLGFMGMTHYHAYEKVRGAKVAAICEKDPTRRLGDWRSIQGNFGPRGTKMNLAGIGQYAEVDELLADDAIDLVDVCLPPALHPDVTVAALKAGKHVICEKPIALRPADADRMVKAAHKAGRMLLIAHVLPYVPEYDFAWRAVKGGKYGRLLGGNFKRVISDPLWIEGFYEPDVCGGPMVDLHIHDAHLIRALFGQPRAVQSLGRMRGEVAEYFNTQFLFDDPSLVVTATSGVINQQGRPFTHGFEIHLEKATLVFDLGDGLPLTVLDERGKVKRPKLGEFDMPDAFPLELSDAVRALKSGTPPPVLDAQLARDALVLCHKQTQSIRSGAKTVRV